MSTFSLSLTLKENVNNGTTCHVYKERMERTEYHSHVASVGDTFRIVTSTGPAEKWRNGTEGVVNEHVTRSPSRTRNWILTMTSTNTLRVYVTHSKQQQQEFSKMVTIFSSSNVKQTLDRWNKITIGSQNDHSALFCVTVSPETSSHDTDIEYSFQKCGQEGHSVRHSFHTRREGKKGRKTI